MRTLGTMIRCLMAVGLTAASLESAPSVGILMLPSEFPDFPPETNYVMSELVKWATQHSMRWFPIYLTDSAEVLQQKIADANLILFTGGDIEIYDPKHYPAEKRLTRYAKTVKYIVDSAKRLNDKGYRKPIWGICLGFQALVLTLTDFQVFFHDDFGNVQQQQRVDFEFGKQSLFQEEFCPEELASFGETPYFWHSYNHGFTLENAQNTPSFVENVDILATSVSVKGVRVVSAVKSKKYPFYGTLFHPEHAQFSYVDSDPFVWDEKALTFNRRMARVMKRLVGKPSMVAPNGVLLEYRKYLRYDWAIGQRDIFTVLDVPIHLRSY